MAEEKRNVTGEQGDKAGAKVTSPSPKPKKPKAPAPKVEEPTKEVPKETVETPVAVETPKAPQILQRKVRGGGVVL